MPLERVNPLDFFAVYEKPVDFPGHFVVRRFEGSGKATSDLVIAETLEDVRKHVPEGCTRYETKHLVFESVPLIEIWE